MLLLGTTRIEPFRASILTKLPVQAVETRHTSSDAATYVSPRSLLGAARHLVRAYDRRVSPARNLYLAYLYGVIRAARPRVVLAMYEAISPLYGALARACPDIHFVAAFPGQLWRRQIELLEQGPVHYLVPGHWDRDRLVAAGFDSERIAVVGPLYPASYREHTREADPAALGYDICIVSQVGVNNRDAQEAIERRLCEHVVRFAQEHPRPLRVVVALRPHRTESERHREQTFYASALSPIDHVLHEHDSSAFGTYAVAERARVSITHYSTVGFDLLWLGRRVLFFQSPETAYKVDEDMVFCARNATYDEFRPMLTRLLELEQDAYLEATAANRLRYAGGTVGEGPLPTDAVVGYVRGLLDGDTHGREHGR